MKEKGGLIKIFISILLLGITVLVFLCIFENQDNAIFNYKDNLNSLSLSKIEIKTEFNNENNFIIGYDERYLYFGEMEDTLRIVKYDLIKQSKLLSIYESSESPTISYAKYLSGRIYIGETYFKENNINFTLKVIDEKGKIESLMNENVSKIPYVDDCNGYILVNYSKIQNENIITTYLESINIDTFQRKFIDSDTCYFTENNFYTGNMIIYCGGYGDGIYYQIVKLDNENLETGGQTEINFYSFRKETISFVFSLSQKLLFISGDSQNLITSDYSYENSNGNTGKIYTFFNNNHISQIIPHISPGYDILGCNKIKGDRIIIYNSDIIYIFDIKNREYYYKRYRNIDLNYSRIEFHKNSFGYIETSNNKSYFYKWEF